MKKSILRMISLAMIFSFVTSQAAFADEAQLMDMVKQMQQQMTELQSTVAMQKAEIQALKTKGPSIQMAPGGVEAAPAISEEDFAKQFDKNLKDKIGESDKWLKDLKFKGDLRLRYEAFKNNGSAIPGGTRVRENTDQNRFRFRLRYGFEKKFSDEFRVGFRMATGSLTDPTSTNQTLTNNFTYKGIYIDQAYATYEPNWAKMGPICNTEVTAGKFKNPFELGSSDLVWDRDVTPEGIYEKFDFKLLKTDNLNVGGYLTAGQFVMMEKSGNQTSSPYNRRSDSNLYAFQLGIEPELYLENMEKPIKLKSAASYYDYAGYAENYNYFTGGAAASGVAGDGTSLAKGNPTVEPGYLAARGFKIFEIYNELNFDVLGTPVAPFFDWAQNLGNADRYAVRGRNDDVAWSLGLKLGKLGKKGTWETSYAYKYIGANALTSFADSDFTGDSTVVGKKGSVIKAGYGLTDYLSLNAAAFIVENLNAPYQATTSSGIFKNSQNRFQLDMSWKF